jgi:ankyrin repeat protein
MFTRGAEANATNADHTPLLVHFAQLARPAAIRILLAHGADPDAGDENRWTALHWFASYGANNRDIAAAAALLLDAKANINAKDQHGATPLHVAATNNSTAMTELLVARGADLDAVDTSGYSPLARAKPGVRAVLLKHGAHDLQPR